MIPVLIFCLGTPPPTPATAQTPPQYRPEYAVVLDHKKLNAAGIPTGDAIQVVNAFLVKRPDAPPDAIQDLRLVSRAGKAYPLKSMAAIEVKLVRVPND